MGWTRRPRCPGCRPRPVPRCSTWSGTSASGSRPAVRRVRAGRHADRAGAGHRRRGSPGAGGHGPGRAAPGRHRGRDDAQPVPAAGPGYVPAALVRQRVYGDFEREYVREDHVLFGDGADVDIAAWLSRTPPERAGAARDRGRTRGQAAHRASTSHRRSRTGLAELTPPEDPSTPAERRASRIERLPEVERAEWRRRFDGAAADTDRSGLDEALAERYFEVLNNRLANDTALAELVSDAGQAWAWAGEGRVTSAAFGALVRRFKGTARASSRTAPSRSRRPSSRRPTSPTR